MKNHNLHKSMFWISVTIRRIGLIFFLKKKKSQIELRESEAYGILGYDNTDLA